MGKLLLTYRGQKMAGYEQLPGEENLLSSHAEDENNPDLRLGEKENKQINVEDSAQLEEGLGEATERLESMESEAAPTDQDLEQQEDQVDPSTSEIENEIDVADIEQSPQSDSHDTGLNGDESEIQGETEQQEDQVQPPDQSDKLLKLPLTRVKHIMKMDPDVTLASQEAVAIIAKAAELFIGTLSRDASYKTIQGRRRIVVRKDLEHIMDTRDCYAFLEGAMES